MNVIRNSDYYSTTDATKTNTVNSSPEQSTTTQSTGTDTSVFTNQTTNTNSQAATDTIVLGKEEFEDIYSTGKYDSKAEAVKDLEARGYEVDDEAEGELGIYTDKSEESIEKVMKDLHMTRKEAIAYLGDSIKETGTQDSKKLEDTYNYYTIEQGLTHEEAIEQMQDIGYNVDSDYTVDNFTFSDDDMDAINREMEKTGCSKKDAIKRLGITPDSDKFEDEYSEREGDRPWWFWEGSKEDWDAGRDRYARERNEQFERWLDSDE